MPEICYTQYVVVRRDLDPLRIAIDTGHAAGEAFYEFARLGLGVEGFNPARTTLILRGARNEGKLLKLEKQLIEKGVPHIAIREPMAPWNGQLMAIGLVPGLPEVMGPHVNDYQNLKLGDPV